MSDTLTDNNATYNSAPYHKEYNLLLVDDDLEYSDIIKEVLSTSQNARYHIDYVGNFHDALEAMQQNDHDVYLVDYNLKTHTGLQLVEQAQQGGCKNPIVLLTGLDDYDMALTAIKTGVSDYLVKSEVTLSLIERCIRYAIERHQTEQRKKMFVATLTHDLKTPLYASERVLNFLEDNKYGTLNDKQSHVVREILHAQRFMLHLVENLLASYRHEDANETLDRRFTCMKELLSTVIDSELKGMAEYKDQQVILEAETHLPMVPVDTLQLYRVFYNLLHNAIEYTQPGGLIEVGIENAGGALMVSIQDNGPGIPQDKLAYLFQAYTTMGREVRHKGLGLGLFLSKNIVELHGGQLFVESSPKSGTRFSVWLPC